MTELEYVISNFGSRFAQFTGKSILLHGSRDYAAEIIKNYGKRFQFVGVMSRDHVPENEFCGLPLFDENVIADVGADLVILTERVKYAEAVYQDIHEDCARNGILLYNMYGIDECAAHRDIETQKPLNIYGWERRCEAYDIVAFETIGGYFREPDENGQLIRNDSFYQVVMWLIDSGIDVKFSLRKSFPEDIQMKYLKAEGFYPDIEQHVIHREGVDLSFRKLCELNPHKKIIYIGNGLVNECLLPRCYGIDTHRSLIAEENIYDCFIPVGVAGQKDIKKPVISKEEILRQIQNSEIISFDVFDTLILRKTLCPEDVFDLVERRGKAAHYPLDSFAYLRKKAASECPFANITEIYAWLQKKYNWEPSITAEIQNLELKTEEDVIIPRTEVVSLLDYAVSLGKKVVLTSDMYWFADVLQELLEKKGITGWQRLYVSCDYGKSKQSGLFDEICKIRRKNEAILHIGDNEDADSLPCEQYGINSIIIPSAISMAKDRGWKEAITGTKNWIDRALLGMTISSIFRDPFQQTELINETLESRLRRYAESVIGPLAVGYLSWLIRKISRNEYDGVIFLSRDGWLLHSIYEKLQEVYNLPPAFYFHINRHAAFLGCVDDPENIRFAVGMANMDKLSGPEALSAIYNIPPDLCCSVGKNETVGEYIYRHIDLLIKVSKDTKIGLQKYFDKKGILPEGTYAMVDFIAKGTTQLFIEKSLARQFKGFCFANYAPNHRRVASIEDYLITEKNKLMQNYMELEGFMTSPEPSVDYLTKEGNVIFAKEIRNEDDLQALDLVLAESEKFALEFFKLFYQKGETIRPELIDEMFAAEGCHWVQRFAWNDWSKSPISTKPWQDTEKAE